MSTPRARIGVIGTGWWSTKVHLPSMMSYEHAEVTAIADPDPDRLRIAGDGFGIAHRFADHRGLLSSGRVDGVVVAVPHNAHYAIAKDAFAAGVHVLLEKPMTLRARDAWDLVASARVLGLHLVTGYGHQFTKQAIRAREIVRSGRIGEVRLVSALFASKLESFLRARTEEERTALEFGLLSPNVETYSSPRSGGGQGYTQVTHPMAMVFWVTGLVAVEVHAFMQRYDLDVDLVDAISYRFANGGVGTVASTGSVGADADEQLTLHYYGTRGFLVHDLVAGRLEATYDDGTRESSADPPTGAIDPTAAPARCLVDLIRGAGQNLAPAEPAAETVAFLEAAYRSAAQGRPIVPERPAVRVLAGVGKDA